MRAHLALPACLAACAVAAPSASALTLQEGSPLRATAAPGEANVLRLMPLDTGPVIVRESGTTSAGAIEVSGCGAYHGEGAQPGDRMCIGNSPAVTLGDGDDQVVVWDAGTEIPIGPTAVDLGPGDDVATTGLSADDLTGGAGIDELFAGGGDDHLFGGEGNDVLHAEHGNDTLVGGPGYDTFDAGLGDDHIEARDGFRTEQISCGDGVDTVVADDGESIAPDCEHVDVPVLVVEDPPKPPPPAQPDPPAAPAAPTPPPTPAPSPSPAPAAAPAAKKRAAAKRRCRTVKVKRRGKTVKVKRCTKRKAAPKRRSTRR